MSELLRRVRGRSTEEQMLATMLVAGVVFAIVALVAFLRPSGSGADGARGPQVRTAHTEANVNAPQGTSRHVAIDQGVQADTPSNPSTITQKLQGLFGAVVTPFGFTTDLPPLIKTAQPAATTSNPNSFPSTFPSLPGTLPPPPPTLPPPPPSLPPPTDTLPPPTTQPPTTTTLPVTTTQPPTTTTQPPTTTTTQPPTTTTTQPPTTTTQPPTTTTQPATTSSTDTGTTGVLPGVPLT